MSTDIPDSHHAIEDRGQPAALHNDGGLDFYKRGNLVQAITQLSLAIKINPAAALPHYNRGYLYGKRREFEKAIADFSRFVEIEPHD